MGLWSDVFLSCFCPACGAKVEERLNRSIYCPSCYETVVEVDERKKWNGCPLCHCSHLYRQKDFNQKVGLTLVAIGVLGAFFTYGLSLLLASLVDWLIYKKVSWVGICYRCQAQFRGKGVESFPGFNLELFDYYKNISRHSFSNPAT